LLNDFVDVPETIDLIDQKRAGPLCKDNREKENAAVCTDISGHDMSYDNLK
jgi:hypothetical protein